MFARYINIHSHRKPQSDEELCIRNCPLLDTMLNVKDLAYPVSVGIHPWETSTCDENKLNLANKLMQQEHVKAIGECGLDRLKGASIERQKEIFEQHIDWANELNKPLIIHCVKAYSDILYYLKFIRVPVIMHGFKGKLAEAEELIRKGAVLSFGERILNDENLQIIVKKTPLNQMFFETDSKPIRIELMYEKASEILHIPLLELKEILFSNYKRIFEHEA